MRYTRLVPSVFYPDLADALALFVECLQFSVLHQEEAAAQPYALVAKDGIKLMLFQDSRLAGAHHPELRIETEDIKVVYDALAASHPYLLHPNLDRITLRPWGAWEFAIADGQVGIRFQQWGGSPPV
ncbi:hypothetical protein CLV84_3987 [Neolewinella xylanilytica]|uniref:VOC domain-containing protein n=1 Tax=Neolewinella xylanilytica TaxID=1514080 RepID=A0A2S6I043_9BACT|nr:hypothetical protein [Neolewinella xylanilytica]PPK84219.1 hypothetical protein CLV84_3987 [Neolewinella xylanilytica]